MSNKTTEALKLAEKLLNEIHRGNMTPMAEESWEKALAAIREALADHVEQNLTMVADHSGDANEMVAEPNIEEMTLTQIAARHKPVQQEPVACIRWIPQLENVRSEYFEYGWSDGKKLPVGTQLYAAPVDAKAIRAEALKESARFAYYVRKEALEEAAKACEQVDADNKGFPLNTKTYAAAIRGLK